MHLNGLMHRAVAIFAAAAVTWIALVSGGAFAQDTHSAYAEAKNRVFESVVKDGNLQFESFSHWASSQSNEYRPLSIFIDDKLGCKPPMDAMWTENLFQDWYARMTGAPIEMTLIDKDYVVAEGRMFREAGSRGAMILDIENRWAAFAMTHSEDHWNHEDGGRRGIVYFEPHQLEDFHYYFSLFLVDQTSDEFERDAKRIARMWIKGYGFGGKDGLGKDGEFRYYPDDIPMNVYEIRCGDAE